MDDRTGEAGRVTLHALPGDLASLPAARPDERYVTRRELALIMGVSVATVDKMVREGMP